MVEISKNSYEWEEKQIRAIVFPKNVRIIEFSVRKVNDKSNILTIKITNQFPSFKRHQNICNQFQIFWLELKKHIHFKSELELKYKQDRQKENTCH